MKKRIIISLAGIFFFTVLFIFTDEFASGVITGLSNCTGAVIPSLFPFMIAASLTGSGDISERIKKALNPITKFFFNLPSDCFFAVIIGQLGGYLAGAKSAQTLYKAGRLTESQSKNLLLFSINAGLGFTVNAVGSVMLRSRESGRILFVSLVVSSLILGFIVRRLPCPESNVNSAKRIDTPISELIVNSVTSAAESTLYACGFVTVFSGICAVTNSLIYNETAKTLISCLLEVTNGCFVASGNVSLPIIAAVCAFGGICVHLQIFSVAKDIKINIPVFYGFRIMHTALAYAVCKIILYFFPIEQSVFLSLTPNSAVWSYSAPASLSLLFLSALLILDLDNREKIW